MLCGHGAPIADLGICYPILVSRKEKPDTSSNVVAKSTSDYHGALISACTDGVLCVWSRGSGHCRRRRKLPPWVGSPSVVRTLPSNARYVCIGCSFIDTVNMSDRYSVDSPEGGEEPVKREFQQRKPLKCAVVVVDTYTLTIVQTVFHGNLSISSLKFMVVVSPIEHKEKHSVVIVDSFGRLQSVPILKDPQCDGDDGDALHKSSSHFEMTVWADGLSEGGQVVSTATCGNVMAFILKSCCIFRLLTTGTTIGEISFLDNLISLEGKSNQSHVTGGMFLVSEDSGITLNADELHEMLTTDFAVWNNNGYAVVYRVSFLNNIFKCEPLGEIPSASHPYDVRLSVSFIQLTHYLLRIESLCFHVEEPLQGKPYITIWSLLSKHDEHGKLCCQFRRLGEGSSFVDWAANSTSLREIEGLGDGKHGLTFGQSSVQSPVNGNNILADCHSNTARTVSSSMVISENLFAPYAVVYGFSSGEIQVLRFDLLHGLASNGNPCNEVGSQVSRQNFLGHTGAILCLAAHRMEGTAKGWSLSQVLVSGSMDCTVRIWDLDKGTLITEMHQHVAPVHQIILCPSQTARPWSDCFLSVGEDSCVALVSLETLRVERMFPGHPSYPAKVVWDSARGYIACLCRNRSGTSDTGDVLYIWDVKTGTLERVLRGTASHSMFDHFCKSISVNSRSGTVLNGNTSVSLLNLPIMEEGSFSHPKSNNAIEKSITSPNVVANIATIIEPNTSQADFSKSISGKPSPIIPSILQSNRPSIKCYCPFPGIATLSIDLGSLMFPCQKHKCTDNGSEKVYGTNVKEQVNERPSAHHLNVDDGSDVHESVADSKEDVDRISTLEECLLRFSLSYLHLWNVDFELDNLLVTDMKLKRPENLIVASGLLGDKGSLTLTFPGLSAILEVF